MFYPKNYRTRQFLARQSFFTLNTCCSAPFFERLSSRARPPFRLCFLLPLLPLKAHLSIFQRFCSWKEALLFPPLPPQKQNRKTLTRERFVWEIGDNNRLSLHTLSHSFSSTTLLLWKQWKFCTIDIREVTRACKLPSSLHKTGGKIRSAVFLLPT